MAGVSYYQLSKKVYDNEEREIIIGVYVNQANRFQLKTGIFVESDRFLPFGCNFSDPFTKKCGHCKIDVPPKRNLNFLEVERLKKVDNDLKRLVSKIDAICAELTKAEVGSCLSKEYIVNALRLINKYDIQTQDITYNKISELEKADEEERKVAEAEEKKVSFFDLLEDFRDNSKKKVNGKREGEKSEVWKKNFNVLYRALRRYEWFIRLSEDKSFSLDIDTITKEDIEDFESFLRNEHNLLKEYPQIFEKIPATTDKRRCPAPQPRGNNAICTLFNKLKAFVNWCIEEGKTTNNPFIGFTGTSSENYGLPYYITLEERNQIADFDLSDFPSLEIQRDIFIFQCCVGCRISDLMKLRPSDIVNDELQYIPHKTKDVRPITIGVPLNDRAKSLVKKYAKKDPEGRLFPFVSMQKYNDAIKRVFEVCGVTRVVSILDPLTGEEVKRPINEVASSHMARRCFVGNLYKKVQDPALIASMSGHSARSKAFERYRKIDEELKREVVKLID